MIKRLQLLIVLQFLVVCVYSQHSSNNKKLPVPRSRYDSARKEFETYEKIHGRFIQTQNANMHFLQWGNPKNTPLIWIHGSFTNSYELLGIADELVNKGFYVLAIDYYGHGLTKIPKHEVSLYHVADDIHALMKAKKIEKAILGGWSRGGFIATAFYDSYPDKVLGLILEDGGSVSTNTHYHKMKPTQLTARVKEIFQGRVSYPSFESEFEAYQFIYDYASGGTQFELLAWLTQDSSGKWSIGTGTESLFHMTSEEQFLETILRPTQATLFGESMSMIEPKIIYRNLNIPMLILDPVSENDLLPFEKENAQLKHAHPDLITHKIYEKTGHNIHHEQPERFKADLSEFLKIVKEYRSK